MFMSLSEISKIIADWAASEPIVVRVYIFGSRARGDHHENSDLDIAIEIEKGADDSNVHETWIYECDRCEQSLAKLLPYRLQLELFDGENTPTVLKGIRRSSVLVYDASNG